METLTHNTFSASRATLWPHNSNPNLFSYYHKSLHPAPTISITFPEGMEQPPIPVHSVTSNTRGGGHGGGSYNGHTGNVGLSHPNNAYYNNNSNYPYDNLYGNMHEMWNLDHHHDDID